MCVGHLHLVGCITEPHKTSVGAIDHWTDKTLLSVYIDNRPKTIGTRFCLFHETMFTTRRKKIISNSDLVSLVFTQMKDMLLTISIKRRLK